MRLRAIVVAKIADILRTRLSSDPMILSGGGMLDGTVDVTPVEVPQSPGFGISHMEFAVWCYDETKRADRVGRIDAPLWGRATEMAMRFALVHALGNDWRPGMAKVNESDMRLGMRFAVKSVSSWKRVVDDNGGRSDDGKLPAKAVRKLLEKGGEMTRSGLQQALGIRRSKAIELVESLEEMGYVTVLPTNRAGSFNVKVTPSAKGAFAANV